MMQKIKALNNYKENDYNKIQILSYSLLIGLIISMCFHLFCGFVLGLTYPWDTPFFMGTTYRFFDFIEPYYWFTNGINFSSGNYFPLGNIILYLFSFMPLYTSLCLFLLIPSIFVFIITKYELSEYNASYFDIFAIAFLSYPFLFVIDRANIEIYVFLFVWLFFVLFKKKKYFISAVILSAATAIKLYPLVFILFFVKKRRYKEFIFTILLSLIFILIIPLLPYMSGVYKLLYILLPLYAFLKTEKTKSDKFYLLIFILLLIPKKYFILPNIQSNASEVYLDKIRNLILLKTYPGISLDIIFNPLLILITSIKIIYDNTKNAIINVSLLTLIKQKIFYYFGIAKDEY